ncbi:unnamed protein product [Effrenium voratum]|nr:unnamed protein product [Effrenium voratum]
MVTWHRDPVRTFYSVVYLPWSKTNPARVRANVCVRLRLHLRLQVGVGGALVQLHLRLADDLGSSAQVCLAWRKVCGKGFEGLEVRHGEWQILPEPETAAKPPLLAPEGVLEDVTKLQLRASGALRLKMPRASSSSEMLKVEIRGPLMETEAIEVSPEETAEISVVYRCLGEGVADVELALEHAVLSTSHAPEVLHLHWRKHCGDDEVYRFLDIFLKGDMNLSKTQAVSQGVALPGFAHCRKRTGSAVDGTRPLTPECEAAKPALEIPAKDGKTTVELKLAAEGQMLPPALQHQPDLSFDRKILRAYVMQPLDLFRPRGKVATLGAVGLVLLALIFHPGKAGLWPN